MSTLLEIFLFILDKVLAEVPLEEVHKIVDDASVKRAHAAHAVADDVKFGPRETAR